MLVFILYIILWDLMLLFILYIILLVGVIQTTENIDFLLPLQQKTTFLFSILFRYQFSGKSK